MIDSPDTFLADFGVDVSGPAGSSGKGILDKPDNLVGSSIGLVSTEYTLTIKTDDFPELVNGDAMTVDGDAYTVHVAQKIDDGTFTKVNLDKT